MGSDGIDAMLVVFTVALPPGPPTPETHEASPLGSTYPVLLRLTFQVADARPANTTQPLASVEPSWVGWPVLVAVTLTPCSQAPVWSLTSASRSPATGRAKMDSSV